MENLVGGIAACGACLFTNPLEVAKTRQQLQGELRAPGKYTVHYRNVVHAFYTIGKVEGILALQKGLGPALYYQFVMNGFRLGTYQVFQNRGITRNHDGTVSLPLNAMAGAFSGCIGAAAGSPFYMVKTHLQAQSDQSIAVGHQHKHKSVASAFKQIFKEHGIKGLWRGVSGAVPRVMVGSGVQLSTFSTCKEIVINSQLFAPHSWMNALAASIPSCAMVVLCMTPFDVVSTRLYNQPTTQGHSGALYRGVGDCFIKIYRTEGVWGFYKGWGASLFRLGPHTILSLVFWSELRNWCIANKILDV